MHCARTALACAVLVAAASLATLAQAQEVSPPPEDVCAGDVANTTGGACDTELTPVAKDTEEFTPVAGAKFAEFDLEGKPQMHNSLTKPTVDFFGTRFRNEDEGFFVGAHCTNPNAEDLESCPRAPAIYQFLDSGLGQGFEISQVYGPELGDDQPGYVAAVAWIAPGKAIAVGGTGHYPRRELPPGSDEDTDLAGLDPNAAGEARVWTYQNGVWVERSDLPGIKNGNIDTECDPEADPECKPMGGLTTVDCSPRRTTDGEFCLAGGLRQLWKWEDGGFTEAFTPTSSDNGTPTVDDGAGWRFRVRQVRFTPGEELGATESVAVAVTSGCCAETRDQDAARVLLFDGARWKSRLLLLDSALTSPPGTSPEQQAALRSALPSQTSPESFYALGNLSVGLGSKTAVSVVLASGRNPGEPEPRSAVITSTPDHTDSAATVQDLLTRGVSVSSGSVRLVSADGDFASSLNAGTLPGAEPLAQPDGEVDWAVGVQRSSGQGLAYTTLRGRNIQAPNPLTCNLLQQLVDLGLKGIAPDPASCQPDEQIAEQLKSGSLVAVDTYALNGFAFTPSGGTGWAVGDKGAIACLNCEGSDRPDTEEPPPGSVGSKAPTGVSGDSAYDSLDPTSAGEVGTVPALAERPTIPIEPRLVPAGTPQPDSNNSQNYRLASIVMSRDGSEGWAVGGRVGTGLAKKQDILFRFDGVRWRPCDAEGIEGQTDPDPACAGLAPLQRANPPVQLYAAARVPLENDSNPTNDFEFEVVAIGSKYRLGPGEPERPAVLRYRKGSWAVDEQAMRQMFPAAVTFAPHSVAFTAPADGWVVGGSSGNDAFQAFHYDGTKWTSCRADPSACGDSTDLTKQVLPLSPQDIGADRYTLTTAGRRVYIAGTRATSQVGTAASSFPFIAYMDTDTVDTETDQPQWTREYDPGCPPGSKTADGRCVPPEGAPQGRVSALSVTRGPDGEYRGWATGLFGRGAAGQALGTAGQVAGSAGEDSDATRAAGQGSEAALLRLDPNDECETWCPWSQGDAADDYLFEAATNSGYNWQCTDCLSPRVLTLTTRDGDEQAFIGPPSNRSQDQGPHPMLTFDEEGWSVLPTPFTLSPKPLSVRWGNVIATPHAMAPDGQGGYWLATRQAINPSHTTATPGDVFFYHYTDRAPEPLFDDAPHPIREEITDAAPGPSGALWVTTDSGTVYRYDRVLGWDGIPIKGWDRGTVITRASAANAVAVGPDGSGVVVGEGGRIADISAGSIRLDAAAGVACGTGAAACTSGRNLVSVAVADDGSAIAGGEARALVCRPTADQGGQFSPIASPPGVPASATFTGVSMPGSGVAYLTTDTGQIFRGTGSGCGWSWTLEDVDEDGQLITLDAGEQGMALNAISVDANGHGYAVGEDGLVLERREGAAESWRRLETGVREDLYSVALPAGSGSGALIGGNLGLVLTHEDGRFGVARTDDQTDPLTAAAPTSRSGAVVGLALMPGVSDGQVEAWAATQVSDNRHRNPKPAAILHYTSAPDEPLLDGGMRRAQPLPDTSAPSDDELTVAAFGRSDCSTEDDQNTCREFQATSVLNYTISRRVTDEILARSDQPGGPDLALFTGDVNRAAGRNDYGKTATPVDVDVMHRRWLEMIGQRFDDPDDGLPLYGAIGAQDLSQVQQCVAGSDCPGTRAAGVGTSAPWQRSFAGRWPGGERTHGDLTFRPLAAGGTELKDVTVDDPTGEVGDQTVPLGGAQTHYAVDIVRSGEPVARLIVLDNSFRSVAGSDTQQNPVEEQQTWLRQTLCKRGSAQDTPQTPCTRDPGQRAMVVMNTPTYSYDTQASGGAVETATDQAAVESTLLTNEADAVISGRLGWNGLYYTTAPGLHFPCPGDGHPAQDGSEAPQAGAAPPCEQVADDQPDIPQLPTQGGEGALPTLVASGAGGTFGPVNSPVPGDASDGFWHGYSMLHLNLGTGDVRVEQRPIFDWIGIRMPEGSAPTHSLRANKRLQLEGFGREAAAADEPLRYDEIDTNAITHRYSLLAADPARPWLAAGGQRDDGCNPYDCLPGNIGSIHATTGEVTSGNGAYPRTYAVAQLSVGGQAATYPLVFEPRASFPTPVPPPPRPATPVPPPPPPAQPPQPNQPAVDPIVPPAIPIATAATPPPPPVPPAPPTFASKAPLDPNIAPSSLDVTPPTAVSQPPTPPVNPAPPSGARREARQRQAAAQKSGADSGEEGEGSDGVDPSDAQNRVNPVDSEHQAATRIEPGREPHPFTALPHADQPSAWSRGLLYGGGLTLAALVLAFGLRTARPTPRRREPEVPAPAFAKERRRR